MAWFILISALILLIIIFFIGIKKNLSELKEHWVPALITGIFIVGILPLANQFYWKDRKNFEKCSNDRNKRYELISSTAKTYTILFKIHTRFHQLEQERSQIEKKIENLTAEKKDNTNLIQIQGARLDTLDTLQLDLEKERIQLESQLAAISGIFLNYFPPDVAKQFNKVAVLYDEATSAPKPFVPTRDHPVVKETEKLVNEMAIKVKEYESK